MTEKAGENMIEKEKPKKATDMEGVRLVAKGLLSTEIHDTEYAPLIINHPFASSGIGFSARKNRTGNAGHYKLGGKPHAMEKVLG